MLDVPARRPVLGDHADHRRRIRAVALERAHPLRDLGRLAVRAAGHQRRDRRRVRPALVRVVCEPARHQQRAEVRVAEPELAVRLRVRLDLGGRVARVADEDLLREEDDVDRVLERLDVELAVLARNLRRFSEARLHAESSMDMYSEHGLDALIRPVFGSVCTS